MCILHTMYKITHCMQIHTHSLSDYGTNDGDNNGDNDGDDDGDNDGDNDDNNGY